VTSRSSSGWRRAARDAQAATPSESGAPDNRQRAHLDQLARKQDALMGQIRSLGGRELGRMSKALNAVFVSVDAARIPEIKALPGVLSVRRLIDYRIDLSETVPYIGAAAVQAAGFDGTGMRVAVLDSGIDYTHAYFGGPGTAGAYAAAYGASTSDPLNTTLDGLFPTAKVVGGFDFVGEVWPTPDAARCGFNPNGSPRACIVPDPDPIDCGPSAIPALAPVLTARTSHTSSAVTTALLAKGGAGRQPLRCQGLSGGDLLQRRCPADKWISPDPM
jgi:hypothetical protein